MVLITAQNLSFRFLLKLRLGRKYFGISQWVLLDQNCLRFFFINAHEFLKILTVSMILFTIIWPIRFSFNFQAAVSIKGLILDSHKYPTVVGKIDNYAII